MLRIISHPIVSGVTPARQLKKGCNAKCNEYLIYGQSKYRLREGTTNTRGRVVGKARHKAQNLAPGIANSGSSQINGGSGRGYERSGFTNGNDNTPRICV